MSSIQCLLVFHMDNPSGTKKMTRHGLPYTLIFIKWIFCEALSLRSIYRGKMTPFAMNIPDHDAARGTRKSVLNGKTLKYFSLTFFLFSISFNSNNSTAKLSAESASMDEAPVEFKLNGYQYKIPRNFLINMSNWSGGEQEDGVSIRFVYPGLKPYSKDTASCLLHKTKCRIYTVYMTSAHFSSEDTLTNLITNSAIRKTKATGPYGFELFEIGPPNARTNIYRKSEYGSPILFDCLIYDVDHKNGGICHHFAHAASGASLSYYFEMNDGLRDAVEVDNSIKALIDRFLVTE